MKKTNSRIHKNKAKNKISCFEESKIKLLHLTEIRSFFKSTEEE